MPVDNEEVAMTQPAPVPTPPPGDPAPVPTPPPTPGPAPADPPTDDKPLGPAGERALATERAERKKLEQQLAALSPLQKLAEALGGEKKPDGKSEVELLNEKFATYETQLTEERQARWRAEVAAAKGLSPEQAARLRGGTAEELLADADALLALFPTAPAGPRTPAPDPSQGARGGTGAPDLDAQIREAQAKGDYRAVISLQNSKLATTK